MSSDSLKHSGGSAQPRPISDIAESLRNSFKQSEFKAAVNELMAREEGLRQENASLVASLRGKSDYFEGERNELKLEKIQWEEERRRLLRELDVKDDQLKGVTRELSSVKEDEEKAIKRYTGLFNEFKDMREEKDELLRNLADITSMVDALKRKLRDKQGVIDELMREKGFGCDSWLGELVEARKKIENLEKEKRKFDACVEALKREKEESLEERIEVEKREVEEIRRKNVVLMDQKDERIKKLLADIKLLEKEKSYIVKEKDKKIRKLEEEKGVIDLERRELETKYAQVEKKFLKLEKDVVTCLCLDLNRDENFESTPLGKILSKIILALDAEDFDLINDELEKDGNIQEAVHSDSALNSQANEPEHSMKSDKQPVEKVRTSVFDCDDATGNTRFACGNSIIIESDDDDKNSQRSIGVKSRRHYSGSLNKHQNYDDTSDDSLNPTLKTKKLKHIHCENSPQKQTLASKDLGEERLERVVIGPKSCSFSKDNVKADGSKRNCGTPKAEEMNKRMQELTIAFRQRKQKKSLECEADMICAFDEDIDLCAKAVCALYRHKKSWISPMKGPRSGQSQECDFERMSDLANYLTDGNPKGKMKKSIDELQKHDPRGRDDCRRLAKGYSKELIDIYRKGEDPFFSPTSTELQYN